MNKTILATIIALSGAYLLGIPQVQLYLTLAAAGYASIGAIVWLFTTRLPHHFVVNLLLVFVGPMAIVALLHMLLNMMFGLEGHASAAFLLAVIVLSGWLGHRLFRGKSQRLF
jgi:TctA family transporter